MALRRKDSAPLSVNNHYRYVGGRKPWPEFLKTLEPSHTAFSDIQLLETAVEVAGINF
jgi:hypothetical protein